MQLSVNVDRRFHGLLSGFPRGSCVFRSGGWFSVVFASLAVGLLVVSI